MKQRIARWLLRLRGWQIEGEKPEYRRYVLIAAPHTSNWDFPLMLAFAAAFGIKVQWFAKHSLFCPPFGWIMRALGGIPVIRHQNSNLVDALVESFKLEADLALVVPTEGTRTRVEYWKSGFYHIARRAGVPIVPSFLDYARKRGGFGPAMLTTDNIQADMAYFREFYKDMLGKFPEQFGPVRLREEQTP
jgi:1-acyl-sn-glycerol-3-phosphate acyltransferase